MAQTNDKSTFNLSSGTFLLGSSDLITIYINSMVNTNKHTLTLTIGDKIITVFKDYTNTSYSWNYPVSFASYFPNNKIGNATLTLTTYTSDNTSLGSYSQIVNLEVPELPENIPNKPVCEKISETPTSTTVNLSVPVCKHGATFDHWEAESSIGEIVIDGNVLTNTVDEFNNNSGIISVQAVDSRGYKSLPVYIHWHSRKRGLCLYEGDLYNSVTKYVYHSGSWVRAEDVLYDINYHYALGDIYNIIYNLDDGTLSNDAPISYKNSFEDIVLPMPTKEGYDFIGWYESSDFSGNAITSISANSTGDKTFYAKWEKILTYNLKTGSEFNALIPSTTTDIVFTDEIMPASASLIDVDADGGVVAWLDGTTFKVSTQKAGQKIIANEDCSYMFANKDVNINGLENLDTSNVINMSNMFNKTGYSNSAFSIKGFSNWNTSSVTDMSSMFMNAGYSANTCDIDSISNWNTSQVESMYKMFTNFTYNCSVDLDLSNWKTSKVTNMGWMFSGIGYNSYAFYIDLSNWNTSNVTNMTAMFRNSGYEAYEFSIKGISTWDVSSVTDMSAMFYGTGYSSPNFYSLDLSGWVTTKLEYTPSMFENCRNLETIYVGDGWNMSKVGSVSMFNGCTSLVGQSGTTYDSSKVDASMANHTSGYLTYKPAGTFIFKIYTTPYYAIPGMTWGEWVISIYNTNNRFAISNNYILDTENGQKYIFDEGWGGYVGTSDIIRECAYLTMS